MIFFNFLLFLVQISFIILFELFKSDEHVLYQQKNWYFSFKFTKLKDFSCKQECRERYFVFFYDIFCSKHEIETTESVGSGYFV